MAKVNNMECIYDKGKMEIRCWMCRSVVSRYYSLRSHIEQVHDHVVCPACGYTAERGIFHRHLFSEIMEGDEEHAKYQDVLPRRFQRRLELGERRKRRLQRKYINRSRCKTWENAC